MSDHVDTHANLTPDVESAATAVGPFARLVTVASESASRQAFFAGALRCIAEACDSPAAMIYVRTTTEAVEDSCHSGPNDPTFWRAALQEILTDAVAGGRARARLLGARDATLRLGLAAVPITDAAGAVMGGIALVAPMTETDVRQRVAYVESLTALASYLGAYIDLNGTGSQHPDVEPSRAAARGAEFESPTELAYSLASSIRNKLGCEHAAIGIVQRNRVRVLAVSGLDEVSPQSPGVAQIRAAMEECFDFGAPIICQNADPWEPTDSPNGCRIHRQWQAAARQSAVASIPLKVDDRMTAIVSLRHHSGGVFDADELRALHDSIAPFTRVFELLRRADRGLLRHVCDAVNASRARMLCARGAGKRIAAVGACLFAAWLIFGSLTYDVTARCTVKPSQLRHLTTPYEAVVAAAHVTAGDTVRAGQLLAELDSQDLELQRQELLAELAVTRHSMEAARAADAPVEVRLAEAKADYLRARLDVIERRIDQAQIVSPFDGVVVAGDLRERVGGVFEQGAPLFQVAPVDNFNLEIEIPEWAGADAAPGLVGRFASNARPEESHEFTLERVRPAAEIRNGRSVFTAEADAAIDPSWARPGMEGVARIEVGRRPAWWVLFHRVIDYVRLRLWL